MWDKPENRRTSKMTIELTIDPSHGRGDRPHSLNTPMFIACANKRASILLRSLTRPRISKHPGYKLKLLNMM
jgi:hypothetical protein